MDDVVVTFIPSHDSSLPRKAHEKDIRKVHKNKLTHDRRSLTSADRERIMCLAVITSEDITKKTSKLVYRSTLLFILTLRAIFLATIFTAIILFVIFFLILIFDTFDILESVVVFKVRKCLGFRLESCI
jgi:hypothetical protein